ncbi:MAG: hypothetical protein ACXWQO_01240 [Bdellovibrionota bacterium]
MKVLLILGFVFLLAGCGTGTRIDSSKITAKSPVNSSFFIEQFDPPTSSVAALPGTVNLTFSESDLDVQSMTAVTHYNLICGGFAYAASSVVYSSGSIITAVVLPTISGLTPGTACQFVVSANLKDSGGVALTGNRFATYTIR